MIILWTIVILVVWVIVALFVHHYDMREFNANTKKTEISHEKFDLISFINQVLSVIFIGMNVVLEAIIKIIFAIEDVCSVVIGWFSSSSTTYSNGSDETSSDTSWSGPSAPKDGKVFDGNGQHIGDISWGHFSERQGSIHNETKAYDSKGHGIGSVSGYGKFRSK